MTPTSPREAATHDARPQADGSPEPLYTVDLPDRGIEVRVTVTVQRVPDAPAQDDTALVERGYGHGV